jgi:hypothetical protein
MGTTPDRDRQPDDQEPAEGSRATVEGALDHADDDGPTPFEEAEAGVSDHVPDA